MNKRVLVVGSSRGIGRAVASQLAHDGFQIVLHGRTDSEQLASTRDSLSKFEARSLCFDLVDRELTTQVLANELEENGAFYGVVLCAGITKDMAFPAMDPESWDSVLRVDLDGFYNVLRPLVLPMVQLRAGGRIVVLSSVSGVVGNRGQVNYSAAKAGLIGAAKALSRELAKRKITVNCVAPGGVDTEMIEPRLREEMLKQIPMGRLAKPEEVASAVQYLFSDGAEYMTGQTLILSGGMI